MNKDIVKWRDYLNSFLNLILTTFIFYAIITHFYSFVFEYLLFQKWVPQTLRAIRPIFCLIAFQLDILNHLILSQFSLMTIYTLLSEFHGNKNLNWGFMGLINCLISMLINLFRLSIPEFLLIASLFAVSHHVLTFNILLSLTGPVATAWFYSYSIFEITALSLVLTPLVFPKFFSSKNPNIRFFSSVSFIILLKHYCQPLLHVPLIQVLHITSHLFSDRFLLAMTFTFLTQSEKHWQTVSYSDHSSDFSISLKTSPKSSIVYSTPSSYSSSIKQKPQANQPNHVPKEFPTSLTTPPQKPVQAIIRSIRICNVSGNAVTADVVNTDASVGSDINITSVLSIAANTATEILSQPLVVENSDAIKVTASAGGALHVIISVLEIS